MAEIPKGTPTGLVDSDGKAIRIGAYVQRRVDCNQDFHGEWAWYEVCLKGIIPYLSYLRSDKGELLPRGYLVCALSSLYNPKLLWWATDLSTLRPSEDVFVCAEPGAHEPGWRG